MKSSRLGRNGSPLSISSELKQEQPKSPSDHLISNKQPTTSTHSQRSFGDVTNSYQQLTTKTALNHVGPSPSKSKKEMLSPLERKEKPSAHNNVVSDTTKTNSRGRNKLHRVVPNPVDNDRFRWAYDTWYSAGLMKRPFTPTNIGRAFWTDAHSSQVKNPSSYYEKRNHDDNNTHQDSVQEISQTTNDDETTTVDTTSSSSPIIQKHQHASSKPSSSSPKMLPEEDIERMPSSDSSEQRGFQRLLDMWRDQQDKDEQQQQSAKKFHLPSTSEEPDGSEDNHSNNKSPSSFHSQREYHSKNTSLVPQRIIQQEKTEDFASRDIPVNIIPYDNNNSKNSSNANESNTSSNMMVKSESFASSDVVEHSYYHRTEKNRALVIVENSNRTYDLMVGEAQKCVGGQLVVRNLDSLAGNRHGDEMGEFSVQCECSQSVFSGNDDLISFFLPQMGMACSCGRQRRGLIKPEDPTAIENVLRPWQCEFLQSFGIQRGEQLVKARHRSGDILARALRQWRKKYDMVPFKTSSCGMAYTYLGKDV